MTQNSSKALSLDEETKLLTYLKTRSERNFTAAALALTTGLRISELCALTLAHVVDGDGIKQTLRVDATIAKNHEPRDLPLPRITRLRLFTFLQARKRAANVHKTTDPLFTSTTWRSRMTPRTFQRAIMDAGVSAIGRPVSPHMLRHTYLTRLLKSSDLATVQDLAGHKSIKSTQLYLHPTPDDLAAAVARTYDP